MYRLCPSEDEMCALPLNSGQNPSVTIPVTEDINIKRVPMQGSKYLNLNTFFFTQKFNYNFLFRNNFYNIFLYFMTYLYFITYNIFFTQQFTKAQLWLRKDLKNWGLESGKCSQGPHWLWSCHCPCSSVLYTIIYSTAATINGEVFDKE